VRKAINAPIGAQRVKYVTHNVTNIYSKDPDQVPAVGKIVNGSSSVVENNFDVDGLNTDADLVSETKDAVSPSLIRKRVVTPQQKIHSNHLLDETQNGQSQESNNSLLLPRMQRTTVKIGMTTSALQKMTKIWRQVKRTHLVARSQTIKMIHKTFSEESLMNLFMSRGESKPERPGTPFR